MEVLDQFKNRKEKFYAAQSYNGNNFTMYSTRKKIFLKLLYLVLQPGQKLHVIEKMICYIMIYELGDSFVRNVKIVLSIPFFPY